MDIRIQFDIGNTYGSLAAEIVDGKAFWGVMDYDSQYDWEPISTSLFQALVQQRASDLSALICIKTPQSVHYQEELATLKKYLGSL